MPVSLTRESAPGLIGTELGVSEWFRIDQSRIDAFADVTELMDVSRIRRL